MTRLLTAAVFLFFSHSAEAQNKVSIEGVWRITEIVTPAGNPSAAGREVRTTNRQLASVIIFTKGYYSQVYENRSRTASAPPADPRNLSDAEKLARYEQWRPFTANSGAYSFEGSTLVLEVIVAKNVDAVTRPAGDRWELKMAGPDAFWMIPIPERASTEPRMKLERLE